MNPIRTLGKQWQEFRNFAVKGNVVDLALAVIIGGAFGAVVNSFVKDVVMEAISYINPDSAGYEQWTIGKIKIGAFLGNLVNFFVVTGSVYLVLVKALGAIERSRPPDDPDAPAGRECPYCLMDVPAKATRCGHCTSELEPIEPAKSAT